MLEHDAHDREVTQSYFQNVESKTEITFLTYSHEVIPFLNTTARKPCLIVLRINALPDTGLEVLRQIKTNISFKHIPVIILGESTMPDWVNRCYAAGANTVINKPSTVELTGIKIDTFIKYWFHVAELSDGVTLDNDAALLN